MSKLETRQISQDLSRPPRGGRCHGLRPAGRSGGAARPQRRGQDDVVLHDRRADQPRFRPHSGGRQGHHRPAHVPARARGHQLPAAGGQRLPQAHGGREPDGHPGNAAHARARAPRNHGAPARPAGPRNGAPQPRLHALGRRAAARGDRPLAGRSTPAFSCSTSPSAASTPSRCWNCSASFST